MSAPSLLIHTMKDVTVVNFAASSILDTAQIESIAAELYKLVDQMDRRKLLLDFSKVQFLASSAVGVLIQLHKKSRAIGGTLVICSMRKELMKVFEIMKLTSMFKFVANESEALAIYGVTSQ